MEGKTIPTHGGSYDTLNFVHTRCVCLYKKVGYTPLQVVEEIRPYLLDDEKTKITYVGRLDPMAEGWMHILWSGDMEEKKKLSSLDKVYEVDIVFGVETDTGDALGLIVDEKYQKIDENSLQNTLADFIGPFTYPYPAYSSPHMKKTLQGVEQEKRNQKGHIYNIELVAYKTLSAQELLKKIEHIFACVHMSGDFRVDDIQEKWKEFFMRYMKKDFPYITIRVSSSSGTYMRTLAEELGKKFDVSACAYSIRRIGIHTQ